VSDVGRGRRASSPAGEDASPRATPASAAARAADRRPDAAGSGPSVTAAEAAPAPSPEDASSPRSSEGHASPLDELGSYIRHQRESAALSLRKLAKIAGVSNPYLSQIERGLRKPSAEILQAIAKALEISSETLYVKAGILDEREIVVDVEVAVAADPHLTGPQRQALLEMYRSFRRLSELKEPRPSRRRQLLDALTAGDVDDDAIRAAEPPAAAEET
jgi:transcriptional regulator with XRE-family HTH domain